MEVTDLPANAPVLVGHIILELLDLCLDIRKGLIYNPDHDDEWIEDQFWHDTGTKIEAFSSDKVRLRLQIMIDSDMYGIKSEGHESFAQLQIRVVTYQSHIR